MLKETIRKQLDKHTFIKGCLKAVFRGSKIIFLDYSFESKPRYGYGKPPHKKLYEMIDASRAEYEKNLKKFLGYKEDFLQIPKLSEKRDSTEPNWMNKWFSGLDVVALYGFISLNKPKRYFEIGSGYSTKVARSAVKNRSLKTKIVSFDPHPRDEIDSICDRVIRKPIEEADLKIFEELEAGDILFVDNSHCIFMNSDATVVFLDILPYLKKGVLVGFHDICLPNDYPPEWAHTNNSEQYVLAAYLLAEGKKFSVVLPLSFISRDKKLSKVLLPLWKHPKMEGVENAGGTFWIRMN